jgi:hypothetical protein
MATNKRLTQLPVITIPTSGTNLYMVEGGQSYQGIVDKIASVLIGQYGILLNPIDSSFMSTGNAEMILNGLNSAQTALLNSDRINFSGDFYYDVDGGTFYDTYVNTSTFDGGPI